jgi:hypothetical protein
VKIDINIGSKKLLITLAVLLMPSVIGLVLGYGTTQPGSSGHSPGEAEVSGRIMSENIQGRSMKEQDISQSLPKSLMVSSALGLGESVPSSTTCTQQTHIGGKSYRTPPNPASMVLVPHDMVVHNNKIAAHYVLDTECNAACDGNYYHYDRYYYGNNQWSNCFVKIQSCGPPCSSLR